jgi:ATP-binding cassette, subfamily F, member 3
MLSVENLKVEFGAEPLFKEVSFVVNDKERVCLVGRNGAGKSTLLKMIAGLATPSEGKIAMPQETTVGYLPQVMKISDSRTVLEETELAFGHLKELQEEYDKVNKQLCTSTDYESAEYGALIEKASVLQERLQMSGINSFKSDTERTLVGLGFKREDFGRPTSEFSGGWRMRIELAKILLKKPDLLLLDEPTNHLDIESILWLENFLRKESRSSVVLVSHDRAFLNNVTSRTLEISCGRIVDYKVKYDDYVKLRAERRAQQLRAYENQQKEIADIKAFVERFRYQATKAVQVQSRLKQLEKMVPVEIDEIDRSTLRLRFNVPSRSGDYPLICKGLTKNYGEHNVFRNIDLTIKRGEKVAFVGRNGEGKSTFVKCIMGQIDYEGELTTGHNVEVGYYAQNQAQLLDETLTVYETIDHVATGDVRLKINDILGAFMFGGEKSEKKVGVLSGGERSRLAMIKLLLQPVNFLILDEPTNHLDMNSKDVLKEAIRKFEGTVLVVSHDRDFLDGLVDTVYEFKDHGMRERIGGIKDFLPGGEPSENAAGADDKKKPSAPCKSQQSYEQQKELKRKKNKIEKRVAELENLISELEADIKSLEQQMENSGAVADMSLFEKHRDKSEQLQNCMTSWEQASQELEDVSNEIQ